MRAIVITRPGGPEVLEWSEVADPAPVRGEALVRVRATAVNRADLLQRMGGYPAPPGAPADVPGLEFAGEIEALGDTTGGWKVGDRVFGLAAGGTYAEKVVLPAPTLAPMPASLPFEEAAAIPEAFVTAWDAMVSQGGLAAGETVLVHAAGSGVGTAAIQIARALHARSIGTVRSPTKVERLRALGLDEAVVVEGGRFAEAVGRATAGRGVELVLDLVGGSYLPESIAALAPRGRLILVGLLAGARAELDLAAVLRKRLLLRGTVMRARPLDEKIAAARLLAERIVPLVERGLLRPLIDRVLPLERAAEAHVHVASNAGMGKTVLTVK